MRQGLASQIEIENEEEQEIEPGALESWLDKHLQSLNVPVMTDGPDDYSGDT